VSISLLIDSYLVYLNPIRGCVYRILFDNEEEKTVQSEFSEKQKLLLFISYILSFFGFCAFVIFRCHQSSKYLYIIYSVIFILFVLLPLSFWLLSLKRVRIESLFTLPLAKSYNFQNKHILKLEIDQTLLEYQ
jgi:hypothetical protein